MVFSTLYMLDQMVIRKELGYDTAHLFFYSEISGIHVITSAFRYSLLGVLPGPPGLKIHSV